MAKTYDRPVTPAEVWADKPDSRWAKGKVSKGRLNVMASRAKEEHPLMTDTRSRKSTRNNHYDPADLERRAAAIRSKFSVYGPDSKFSYFKDFYTVSVSENEQAAMSQRQVQGTGGFTVATEGIDTATDGRRANT